MWCTFYVKTRIITEKLTRADAELSNSSARGCLAGDSSLEAEVFCVKQTSSQELFQALSSHKSISMMLRVLP